MKLTERIRLEAAEHPLRFVLVCAALVRLMAVVFAKGFMASDDYFVYWNVPWNWSRGIPTWFDMDHPSGFSLVYPGINYLLILLSHAIGISNPETIMVINRALHAAWSLAGVALAFRLTEYVSGDRKLALAAGLMAAFFSFLPYGSVRNLPEVVCIPFVMWYLLNAERAYRGGTSREAFIAGVAIGLAFVVRYQSLLFGVGAGALFLYRRQWKLLGAFALGALIPALGQGVTDLIAYGKFFGAPLQYFVYNVQHSADYIVGPWYRYLLLFAGLFIPPFSLIFLPATLATWKKSPITLLSTLVFFIIHSATPAKQERFVIPAVLPVIVLGTIGLESWIVSIHQKWFDGTLRWLRRWFWAVNTILMILFLFHYGKRGQIESLNDVRARGDMRYLVVDRTEKDTWLPLFYLGVGEERCYWIGDTSDWQHLQQANQTDSLRPNYALVYVPKDIREHVKTFKQYGMDAEVLERFGPGPLEWLLAKGNPRFNSTNEVWLLRLTYPAATQPQAHE